MALLDLQVRGRELGRIRIGATVVKNEKRIPVKLDTFRFTTPSERNAQLVAELFGGTCQPWEERPGQWEVITTATEIPVTIPPGHTLTQSYELWSRGGIQRRCDGVTREDGAKCVCPAAIGDRMELAAKGQACKPMTRLSVILPDLIDLGVWLIVSGGYNAALELQGAADLLVKAAGADVFLPATLRLEQRSKVTGGQTHNYGVPVLEVGATIRALVSGEYATDGAMALPPPPGMKALPAGHTQPPPPQQVDEPVWATPSQGSADDDIVDAEVVADADTIATNSLGCETRGDVQHLVDEAQAGGVLDQEATHPVTGRRMVLRDMLQARWRELPQEA